MSEGAEKGYNSDLSSFKLELLALKWAISEKFREYLLGRHTMVWTDNNPLAHLQTAKLGATAQRWVPQLSTFDLEIRYRSGRSNKCADALSRNPPNMAVSETADILQAVTQCTSLPHPLRLAQLPECVQIQELGVDVEPPVVASSVLPSYSYADLISIQKGDESLGEVWHLWERQWDPGQGGLNSDQSTPEVKSWLREWLRLVERNGVLYRAVGDTSPGQVFQLLVPKQLQTDIKKAAHDQWGHQGVGRTLALIKNRCFWPSLNSQVKQHIRQCFHCTVTKAPSPAIKPPMRHLLAFRPLERLAIDFLKLDRGHGNIEDVLVMTDAFTKLAVAAPCKDQTAKVVAQVLHDQWFVHYGLPFQIHSDQGRNFESRLVRELCDLYGIRKTKTTPYHPQGNGQTERFNKTLCGLIKSLELKDRKNWPKLLPHLIFVYNSTPHSITGYTPYTLMFGRDPSIPLDHLISNA